MEEGLAGALEQIDGILAPPHRKFSGVPTCVPPYGCLHFRQVFCQWQVL